MNTPRNTTLPARLLRAAVSVGLAAAALTTLSSAPAAQAARVGTAVPSAAPIGKLQPSGCERTGTSDLCDLYARTGTTQVLGRTIPIWGFSTDASGTATAPGPVLVVHQGDEVTVRLHNLLSEQVSLAFPGQPASTFSAGLDSTSGAAPADTASYTFTANRPGTFVYEAGHTPDGTRQVAMGLAGALVVLSDDGTASGQAYDDEAVLVLSEIDPALNAAPATFDMRDFQPRYRLINGRPFPSTDRIPTDQGHKVLLRYVNVGAQTHAMSLLGATQLQVSEDGHAKAHPERETVATLTSGTTADTVVSMPSGPDTKVTVFETGGHLDNDGQTEADPGRVATGGMMTFLDTDAPAPIDDHVGPVASHLAVSPNPSDGLSPVTVRADLSDATSGGSPVDAAEVTVDDPDIAPGSGLPMGPAASFGNVGVTGVTAELPAAPAAGDTCTDEPFALSCLDAGKHVVYVRGHDTAGNWGVVGSVVLNLPKTGPSTTNGSVDQKVVNGSAALAVSATGDDSDAEGVIDRAEMFLDTAGDNGSGAVMTLNRSAAIVSEDAVVPTSPTVGQTCASPPFALSCLPTEGTHHLLVHSHDSLGLWGPMLDIPFVVDRTGPTVDAAAVAPNPSNGLISATGNTGYLKVSAQITDRDQSGAVQNLLTAGEGYFAPATASPAPGTGFKLLAVDGRYDGTSEQVYGLIPLSQVKAKANGTYQVYVRGKDEAGNWGDLFAMPLKVDKTAPVLASVTASPNPTNGAALLTLTAPVSNDTSFQTAEFWTGTTDPGVGKGTRVSVSYVGGAAVVTVPLTGVAPGSVPFSLRVQDLAGNWSNAVNTTVTVSKPNAIFADGFDTGNLNAWSARTNVGAGSMVTSAAAGIPTGGANQGMAVTGTGTHYVTDNSPVAETGYHARFSFSPNTFTSGTAAAVTLFDARTANNGGGGSVFSVEYRKNAGTSQVRATVIRSTGGNVTSAWQNLTAGAHELRVDWVAGPATGTNPGSLKLSVDSTAVFTQTGNTNTLRVESARLGLVAGTNASSTGTAYADSFQSTRNTLP